MTESHHNQFPRGRFATHGASSDPQCFNCIHAWHRISQGQSDVRQEGWCYMFRERQGRCFKHATK